jgi:hypothetical protein
MADTGQGGSSAGTSKGYTVQALYAQLLSAGASTVQAIGMMANAINESSLDPEANASDPTDTDPDARAYGLWQFNTGTYPDAAKLVTGHPMQDMEAQVTYLIQHGGLQAASGTTFSETAGNFAANFERCDGCQPGGAQYQQRVDNASTVAGWIRADNWPTSNVSASGQAQVNTSDQQSGSAADCAWQIGWGGIPGTSWLDDVFGGGGNVGSGEVCIISKSELRALAGLSLGFIGGVVLVTGVAMTLIVMGLRTGVVGKAADAAAKIPGAEGVALGLAAAHKRITRKASDL